MTAEPVAAGAVFLAVAFSLPLLDSLAEQSRLARRRRARARSRRRYEEGRGR